MNQSNSARLRAARRALRMAFLRLRRRSSLRGVNHRFLRTVLRMRSSVTALRNRLSRLSPDSPGRNSTVMGTHLLPAPTGILAALLPLDAVVGDAICPPSPPPLMRLTKSPGDGSITEARGKLLEGFDKPRCALVCRMLRCDGGLPLLLSCLAHTHFPDASVGCSFATKNEANENRRLEQIIPNRGCAVKCCGQVGAYLQLRAKRWAGSSRNERPAKASNPAHARRDRGRATRL